MGGERRERLLDLLVGRGDGAFGTERRRRVCTEVTGTVLMSAYGPKAPSVERAATHPRPNGRTRRHGATLAGLGEVNDDVTGGPIPKEALFARTLVELADTLVADFDVVELLTLLADRCVAVLDVAAAGLMLAGPDGGLRVMASSSEAMRLLELFELQSEEGPCLDCYSSGQPVVNQDLAGTNSRWPRFTTEALAAGFQSVQALPMRLRGTVIGALNLFNVDEGEMQAADVEAAQALADVATIAILQHRAKLEAQVVNQQLQNAQNSRIVIEQAKGVVAEREHVTMEQAFSVLRNHARNRNLRLVDVAEAVISGSIDSSALDQARRDAVR